MFFRLCSLIIFYNKRIVKYFPSIIKLVGGIILSGILGFVGNVKRGAFDELGIHNQISKLLNLLVDSRKPKRKPSSFLLKKELEKKPSGVVVENRRIYLCVLLKSSRNSLSMLKLLLFLLKKLKTEEETTY